MYKNKKTAVIIAAAGAGKRMESPVPKQFLKIGGEPVLVKSIRAFCRNTAVDHIFIVINEQYADLCSQMIEDYGLNKVAALIIGGKERQDSVYKALQEINRLRPGTEYVLVHDGARPFVSRETIDYVIAATAEVGAAVACVPVKNSIRQKEEGGSRNLKRDTLYTVQTPQGFKKSILVEAYEQAFADGYYGTDDASLVERIGQPIEMVKGHYNNIKITTKEDMPMENRVGTGYDVHRLTEGRKLILGGVEIPFEKGLLGHSDADVLTHAIMDALLGAAGLGDIGTHFPDNDSIYKAISSLKLLGKVRVLIQEAYYQIGNIDATVIAQRPKIKTHIEEMRKNIAAALEIEETRVSIKATTTEKLGFEGREEGIAAQAVSLVYR